MTDEHRIAALNVLGTDDPRNAAAVAVNLEAVAHATLYVGDQLARIADALTGETLAHVITYDGGRP
jgi:hypothetical protein